MNSKLDHSIFYNNIKQNLSENLSEKVIMHLSGLLALDYDNRFKDKSSAVNYVQTGANRLKIFLKERIIDNDNFSNIIKLFIVAITPDTSAEQLFIDQNKNIEISADILIGTHFQGYEKNDLIKIKSLLIEILTNYGIESITEFIKSNYKVFKTYIDSNLQKNIDQIILNQSKNFINKLVDKTNSLTNKIDKFKQTTTKISIAFGLLSVAALSLFTGGIAAPVLMIPALLLTLKAAPKVGIVISEAIVRIDYGINSEIKMINSQKKDFLKNMLFQRDIQTKDLKQKNNIQDKIVDLELENLDYLKNDLNSQQNKQASSVDFLTKEGNAKQSLKTRAR